MNRALARGENVAVVGSSLTISVTGASVDVVAFALTGDRRVRTDDDFVFYNNPRTPEGTVVLTGPATVVVDLVRMPPAIERVAVAVSVDPPAVLGSSALTTTITGGAQVITTPADGLTVERAAVMVEVYRRASEWKVRSISAGWEAGFAALVREHGVSVDDEPAPADAPAPTPRPTIRMVKGEESLPPEKRERLNLRKQQVHEVLVAHGAAGATARVILVIDKTLSMRALYKNQTVHRVVDRMIPVATQLDSDGTLEAYLYGSGYARLPDVTVAGADLWASTYIHLTGRHGQPEINYDKQIGGVNEELPIMNAVLGDIRDRQPVLVLFFTDGGFYGKVNQVRELIRAASSQPVFWQFIGLGRNRFGILTELDTLTGRVVDNAGFFAIDDIDTLSDADLYKHLLSEFPTWLREAVGLGIVGQEYTAP